MKAVQNLNRKEMFIAHYHPRLNINSDIITKKDVSLMHACNDYHHNDYWIFPVSYSPYKDMLVLGYAIITDDPYYNDTAHCGVVAVAKNWEACRIKAKHKANRFINDINLLLKDRRTKMKNIFKPAAVAAST